jgi:hypothetical protein
MDFNFNRRGSNYAFGAIGQSRRDFGALGERTSEYLNEVVKTIAETYEKTGETDRKLMISANGCVERLLAFLLQAKRIVLHAEQICKQGAEQPTDGVAMMVLNPNEVLFDFESLLFQGRALLDRLTFFLANQIYGQDCDRFNKLVKILENFKQKDPRAVAALTVIGECFAAMKGLLVDSDDGKKSLRSDLIHKSTAGERTRYAFVLHFLSKKQIIRFDYEVEGYPLIGSAWTLSKYVPYLVLNCLGIYLHRPSLLAMTECEPTWKNRFVHFSKFVDSTSAGPEFSAAKMNPSGFEIMTTRLKPSVLEFVDEIPSTQERTGENI